MPTLNDMQHLALDQYHAVLKRCQPSTFRCYSLRPCDTGTGLFRTHPTAPLVLHLTHPWCRLGVRIYFYHGDPVWCTVTVDADIPTRWDELSLENRGIFYDLLHDDVPDLVNPPADVQASALLNSLLGDRLVRKALRKPAVQDRIRHRLAEHLALR